MNGDISFNNEGVPNRNNLPETYIQGPPGPPGPVGKKVCIIHLTEISKTRNYSLIYSMWFH